MENFWSTIGALISGGALFSVAQFAYQEFNEKRKRTETAKSFVDNHLDQLLKSADELVGKLRSLAEKDFSSLKNKTAAEFTKENDGLSLLFLLACLWANIEIIRRESVAVQIADDPRGAKLQSIVNCLESRRNRLVDRISQRAVGEHLIANENSNLRVIHFIEFEEKLNTDQGFQKWAEDLINLLTRLAVQANRQRLLQYGIIVHCMIDSLDPKHKIVRDRPSYPNKLTPKTKRGLKYRVFGVYLDFVDNQGKYTGH